MRSLAALCLLACGPACAQIVLDGRLGPAGPVNAVGGTYAISSGLGTQVGSNLFHSFTTFNLGSGLVASFSGNPGTANVVARVTGGAPSSIDGTMRSSIAGASLWFINPWGITFGPNAHLDVNGAFHASTAGYLALGTGPGVGRFDALNPNASNLTTAAPSAFGFLGNPAPLKLDRSQLFAPGGMSFIGGNLTITGTSALLPAVLHAPGGRINLASVASAGELGLAPGGLVGQGIGGYGDIRMKDAFVLTDPSSGAIASGPVYVRGGRLTMEQSYISTGHASAVTGGEVKIDLSGDFEMTGGLIRSLAQGNGNAGNITLNAAGVTFSDAAIDVSAFDYTAGMTGPGSAGELTIAARENITLSRLSVLRGLTGDGSGGLLRLSAKDLVVDRSFVSAATQGDGNGGEIRITVDNLHVRNGGGISAATNFNPVGLPGFGGGGSIDVRATGSINISGAGSSVTTSTTGYGDAGNISLAARSISIADGASIVSASFDPYQIASVFGGNGNAGEVRMHAGDTIALVNGSVLATAEAGNGGNVFLTAPNLIYLRNSRVLNLTQSSFFRGGDTTIDPILIVLDNSQISSFALGSTRGTMSIAGEFLLMSGDSSIDTTGTLVLRIANPDANVNGLGPIAVPTFDLSQLLANRCANRHAERTSSLVGAGRGGLPAGPESSAYADYGLAQAGRVADRPSPVLLACAGG